MQKYNPKKIEKKWQKIWDKSKNYKAEDFSKKPKYYCLIEFPYPSGAGLHVGHLRSHIAIDIIARKRRMEGYNVIYPIGWDAFGLPTENFAIKTKTHPKTVTENNIKNFTRQIKSYGPSFDWSREINTTDPKYYKWTQWIFLKLFNSFYDEKLDKARSIKELEIPKDLNDDEKRKYIDNHRMAYEAKMAINWCPSCKIGLANEEVVNGACERCGATAEKKMMKQWMLRITKYAERLIKDLETVDYLDKIKAQQVNWIGKSAGAKISFSIIHNKDSDIKNFSSKNNDQRFSQTNAKSAQNIAENNFLYKNLTYKIRGAIFNVRKQLGLGHKENVYHKALEIEFKKNNLKFESKKNIELKYDGQKVGIYQPDFIIDDKVLIELKAVPEIGKPQTNQTWTYLKGSKYKLALLANFGSKELQIKRMIYDTARNSVNSAEAKNSAFSASSPRDSATSLEVFTTRPDTLFGCTYMVVAPEHPIITNYKLQITNYDEVKKYIEEVKQKSDLDRTDLAKEKTGVELKGIKAVNPVNNEEIPIWAADYVLSSYGTGAIMAVPAHDERDFEFAKKFGLEIRFVVKPKKNKLAIIIHGFEDQAKSDFFPWTKKELEKLGYEVILKDMPNSYHPKMEEWISLLDKYKSKINENTIIIGHSLGGSVAPYFVSKLNKKIKALYLVAPTSELVNFNQLRKEWKGSDIDSLEKIVKSSINWNKVKENLEKLIVFLSDNDDCIPIKSKNFFENKNAKCVVLHNRGHIQDPKFPELLQEILEDNTKTPKHSSEVFGGPESNPRRKIQTCHFTSSINDNKKLVKSKNGAEPAEGFEPSDHKMTSLDPRRATGKSAPSSLYQNNKAFVKEDVYIGDGININSNFLNGLETKEAKKQITKWLEKNNLGKKAINYKLRDWIFSRQHYWGEPIPIIKCKKCGNVALKEKDLPLELPDVKNYEPTDTGKSPLAKIDKWVNVKCPKCNNNAKRETDTMPNWAGSSWYYLRYIDPNNDEVFASKEKLEYWMPVDLYNGGMEHTTLHLLYSRFWHKFLFDLGYVNTSEPYKTRRSQGMILAEDGQKMSKSRGNVINPDDIIGEYGADTVRLYEMFMGPYSEAIPWSANSLVGMSRFLEKVWELNTKVQSPNIKSMSNIKYQNPEIESLLHKTIKKVTEDIENLKFNTAISQLMILLNEMEKEKNIQITNYQLLIILLSPFTPHITEELWETLGNKESIFKQKWPKYNPELAKEKEIELVIQINGKVRDRIKAPTDISEEDAKKIALESERIKKWTEGKEIRKIIFVKGKLVNIVI